MAIHSQGQSFSLSQVFLLGDSKGSCLFQKKQSSKEIQGIARSFKDIPHSVVADEAEVYHVYLLFVWQFSKVLIQVSKVELIFLYFFSISSFPFL